MEVVDISLGYSCKRYCSFIVGFTKKIDSCNPTIMSLNSVIKNGITCWCIDHNVVLLITCHLVTLREFASHGKQLHNCLGAKLHGPQSIDPFSPIDLMHLDLQFALLHCGHNSEASLDGLINFGYVIQASIVVGDME